MSTAAADITFERGLPASADAERSILGAILIENSAYDEAAEILRADDFALDSHQRIFSRIAHMQADGKSVDIVTLAEELSRLKEVEAVGGVAYLADLTFGLPRRLSIAEYVRIVKDKSLLRQIISTCSAAITRAADQGEDALSIIESTDKDLLSLSGSNLNEWPDLAKQIARESKRIDEERRGELLRTVPIDLHSLDMVVPTVTFGRVTVFGGRPKMGKTFFKMQVLRALCRRGIPCHAFTIELESGEFLRRLYAMESGVPYSHLEDPSRMSNDERNRVAQAEIEVSNWPIVVDDVTGLTSDKLAHRARLSIRRHGTQWFGLDYLQKMRFSKDAGARYIEVTDATQTISAIAKEEKTAWLVLSSLSTKGQRNRDEAPTMDDLRQSGDIAYEAHTIMLLHRRYDPRTNYPFKQGQILIDGVRSGTGGIVTVKFDPSQMCFVSDPRDVDEQETE